MDGHKTSKNKITIFFICLFLIAASLLVYAQVRNFNFVNMDDEIFTTGNPHVQDGLALKNIKIILTAIGYYNNRLSMLSHMLDRELFGLDAGWHHMTSLFIHIVNGILLFFIFFRMTSDIWKSAFVACIFALHPLNVESVAWVAERRNVLSTFFWFITTLAYVRYTEKQTLFRYILVCLFHMIGLMSKAMAVTLPFTLLLLDFWPLERFKNYTIRRGPNFWLSKKSTIPKLILEKIPLILISMTSILTVWFRGNETGVYGIGGMVSIEHLSLKSRILNSLLSYVKYIIKMFWPENLAVYYPYLKVFYLWELVLSGLVLTVITAYAVKASKRRPWFSVGWFWYMGTLLTVSGIVQLGDYAMADRYAYIPLIGLFVIIAWGVPDLLSRWRYKNKGIAIMSLVFIMLLIALARIQTGYWRNSITLFEHCTNVTTDNYIAHNNFGFALQEGRRFKEAADQYSKSLSIAPMHVSALNNLGGVMLKLGDIDEAVSSYSKALQIDPNNADANINMGCVLLGKGRTDKALKHFLHAIRLNPRKKEGYYNLGVLLEKINRRPEAIKQYKKALEIHPGYSDALNQLGLALFKTGKTEQAMFYFSKALENNPGFALAHNNMGMIHADVGRTSEAKKHYHKAIELEPDFAEAYNNLAIVLFGENRFQEAIAYFKIALQKMPESKEFRHNLKAALAIQNKNLGSEDKTTVTDQSNQN